VKVSGSKNALISMMGPSVPEEMQRTSHRAMAGSRGVGGRAETR
jgi:hypothetical protein